MDTLKNLENMIHTAIYSGELRKLTLSNPRKKDGDFPFHKVCIEQRTKNSHLFYQFSLFFDTRVKHENYNKDEAERRLFSIIALYKQCNFTSGNEERQVLINNNGMCKILPPKPVSGHFKLKEHNNEKHYKINETEQLVWLQRLGVMGQNGRVLADKQKKFRQINKFLELVADVEAYIPQNAKIVDVGCGRAYLTFALYDYLCNKRGKSITITGVDIKKDVMTDCQNIADELGFSDLSFVCEKMENFKAYTNQIDMVVCLHACDTATDDALAFAVKHGAKVILSAPCCQHELFSQIQNEAFYPLLKHGILKEKFSSLLTDALRASLLSANGYQCQVMEFIDAEHTPKNIMIRAIKQKINKQNHDCMAQYNALSEMFNVKPSLLRILEQLEIEKAQTSQKEGDVF